MNVVITLCGCASAGLWTAIAVDEGEPWTYGVAVFLALLVLAGVIEGAGNAR